MEQAETKQAVSTTQSGSELPSNVTSSAGTTRTLAPQGRPTCGTAPAENAGVVSPTPPPWIYAVGRIEPRFPRLSVEKEFAQATGRTDTKGLTDRQALQSVLSKPEKPLSCQATLLAADYRGAGDLHLSAPRPGGHQVASGGTPS
jgi:hypothetical protein